jgi:hypothetical protein
MPSTKTLLICSKVSTRPTLVVSSSWCSRRKKYIYQGWSQGCFRAFMPITCVCLPSTLWHSLSQSQTFVPWLYPEHLNICEWLLKCISFLFPLCVQGYNIFTSVPLQKASLGLQWCSSPCTLNPLWKASLGLWNLASKFY